MTTSSSKSPRFLVRLLSLPFLLPLMAFADGDDDFNDNSKDTSKWGTDIVDGNGVLTESSQWLQFTCASPTTDDEVLRPWKLQRFPANANWTIQVDTFNDTSPSLSFQVSSGGLTLISPHDADSEVYVELYASPFGLPTNKGFDANLLTAGVTIGNADTSQLAGAVPVLGAVRMVYDGTTKVVLCQYDADISDGYQWSDLASFGLAGAGGSNTNTDWGLSGTDQFTVYVYGFSEGMIVSNGQNYLDNFVETGGVTPSGAASPSPVGSFGFTFPTNNALLVAIANLSGHYSGIDPFNGTRPYAADLAQDESGKLTIMGSADGIADSHGSTNLSGSVGSVATVDGKPTLKLKSSFAGTEDGFAATAKGSGSGAAELTDIGSGSNGLAMTFNVSGKFGGLPIILKNTPVAVPETPDIDANLNKSWSVHLDITNKVIKGKLTVVASAQLLLPNGDTIVYPEKKAKYSTTKGYKLSFAKGTNTTINPPRIDKKSSIAISGLTFNSSGNDWVPSGGTISYRFLGQKGTANLLDFTSD